MEHKIVKRNINSLIFAEYNPRQLTTEQHQNLKDSIQRFGIVDPIIVNKNKSRENIIVGGHQRVRVAKSMNITEVPVLEIDLSYEKEKELNVRLNKNTGEWDFDTLANNFEIESLKEWGFLDTDLDGFFDNDPFDEMLSGSDLSPPKIGFEIVVNAKNTKERDDLENYLEENNIEFETKVLKI